MRMHKLKTTMLKIINYIVQNGRTGNSSHKITFQEYSIFSHSHTQYNHL